MAEGLPIAAHKSVSDPCLPHFKKSSLTGTGWLKFDTIAETDNFLFQRVKTSWKLASSGVRSRIVTRPERGKKYCYLVAHGEEEGLRAGCWQYVRDELPGLVPVTIDRANLRMQWLLAHLNQRALEQQATSRDAANDNEDVDEEAERAGAAMHEDIALVTADGPAIALSATDDIKSQSDQNEGIQTLQNGGEMKERIWSSFNLFELGTTGVAAAIAAAAAIHDSEGGPGLLRGILVGAVVLSIMLLGKMHGQTKKPTSPRQAFLPVPTLKPPSPSNASVESAEAPGSTPDNFGSSTDDNLTHFNGQWVRDEKRSGSLDAHMKNLGVPWIARKALAKAGGGKKILFVNKEKGTWTEDSVTAIITNRTVLQLDGREQSIVHPADRSNIKCRTTVSNRRLRDDCCASVVVSEYQYESYGHHQTVTRMLVEKGETYLAINKLTLKDGGVLNAEVYWRRAG